VENAASATKKKKKKEPKEEFREGQMIAAREDRIFGGRAGLPSREKAALKRQHTE